MHQWGNADWSARLLMPNAILTGPERMSKHGERRKRRLIRSRLIKGSHAYIQSIGVKNSLAKPNYVLRHCCDDGPQMDKTISPSSHLARMTEGSIEKYHDSPVMSMNNSKKTRSTALLFGGACYVLQSTSMYVLYHRCPERKKFFNEQSTNDFDQLTSDFTPSRLTLS